MATFSSSRSCWLNVFGLNLFPAALQAIFREVNEGQLMHLERMSPDLINSQNGEGQWTHVAQPALWA
jgi:hypothetical protein